MSNDIVFIRPLGIRGTLVGVQFIPTPKVQMAVGPNQELIAVPTGEIEFTATATVAHEQHDESHWWVGPIGQTVHLGHTGQWALEDSELAEQYPPIKVAPKGVPLL